MFVEFFLRPLAFFKSNQNLAWPNVVCVCCAPYVLQKGPGAYDVHRASRQCLKAAPSVSFGGLLNKIDRGKTGPLNVVDKKNYVPGPCSYAVAADYQVTTRTTSYTGMMQRRALFVLQGSPPEACLSCGAHAVLLDRLGTLCQGSNLACSEALVVAAVLRKVRVC